MKVDNFDQANYLMKFTEGKPCFYKFCIIVRNKDGLSPLINKTSLSAETLIKEWYVDSKEYFEKVKPEMKALAKATRGRLYMTVDRKDSYKTLFSLINKTTDMLQHAMNGDTNPPRRLNKLIRSITSSADNSTHSYRHYMYDLDTKNTYIRLAVCNYLLQFVKEVLIFETLNGFHIVVPRSYKIDENWQQKVADEAFELAKKDDKLTIEDAADIIKLTREIKVEPNQLTLVYFED